MIPQTKKGFTLIELLVVITIIGILATGAVAVYTSNIQRARDTTRINEVKALQGGIEQFYQNKTVYPDTIPEDWGSGGVLGFMNKLPKDPKQGETCAMVPASTQPFCGYVYNVGADDNGIEQGAYEVSAAFENKGNLDTQAANDKMGYDLNDENRFELGVPTQDGIDTQGDYSANDCATAKTAGGIYPLISNKCSDVLITDSTATGTPINIAGN